MAEQALKGTKGEVFIGLKAFEDAKKKGIDTFNGKIKTYNIIEYVDANGNARQLAIVDVKLGDNGVTTGVMSVPMLDRVIGHTGVIQLTFTDSRYNEYEEEDQPVFRVKGIA